MSLEPESPSGAEAEGSERRPPGPPRAYLDKRERAEIIDKLGDGYGRDQVLRELKIPPRKFRNTYEEDDDFREEVKSAQRASSQALDRHGYMLAFSGGETGAEILVKLWDRRDRGRDMNEARAESARIRAFKAAEADKDRALQLHLAEMRAKALAEKGASTPEPGEPDFSRLTPEQLETFRELARKIGGGDPG